MCSDIYNLNTYEIQELEKRRQEVREELILSGMGHEIIEDCIDSGPASLGVLESDEDAFMDYENLYLLEADSRKIFEEKKQELASIDKKIQQLNAGAEI